MTFKKCAFITEWWGRVNFGALGPFRCVVRLVTVANLMYKLRYQNEKDRLSDFSFKQLISTL